MVADFWFIFLNRGGIGRRSIGDLQYGTNRTDDPTRHSDRKEIPCFEDSRQLCGDDYRLFFEK